MKLLLKQASLLFVVQASVRVVSFFYMVYLANALDVAQFGLFSTALAYFALASAVVDFGFNRYLMREIAKNNDQKDLILNVTMLRLTIFAVFFAIISVLLYSFDPNKMRVVVILLSMLALFPHSIAQTFDGVLIALGKIKISALSLLVLSISTTLTGSYLVWSQYGAIGGAIALIVGHLVYLFFLLIVLSKKQMLTVTKVEGKVLKDIFFGVLPYGILGILGLIYFRIDTLLLNYLKGDFETGIYAAGYKFLETLLFVPAVLAAVIFPKFSKLHSEGGRGIKELYFSSAVLMGLFGILITLVFIFILPFIISYLLPNYKQSILVIQILSLGVPFIFVHSVTVQLLFSSDKYLKQIIYLSMVTVLFNIITNIIFIPQYGFIGAAWVTVASEILSFAIFFILIKQKKLI